MKRTLVVNTVSTVGGQDQMEGVAPTGFAEKPVSRSHINAGVYAFTPAALILLARNQHCDMPTQFDQLREVGKSIVTYPMHEPWLDVGRQDDLKRANATIRADAKEGQA